MNYRGFAFPVKGFMIDGRMPAGRFMEVLAQRRGETPPAVTVAMQNLIDSHDTERVASMIVSASRRLPYEREDSLEWFDYDWGRHTSADADDGYLLRAPTGAERDVQRLIALFQMTYVGAPMIYYGTESGMWSGDDPDDRQPMVWEDLVYDDQSADPFGRDRRPDAVRFDPELHEYYRSVIALRRSHAALRRGDFEPLLADDTGRVVAFARTHEEERLVVVLNASGTSRRVALPSAGLGLGAGEGLYPILSSTRSVQEVIPTASSDLVTLDLQPREGIVLIRTGVE